MLLNNTFGKISRMTQRYKEKKNAAVLESAQAIMQEFTGSITQARAYTLRSVTTRVAQGYDPQSDNYAYDAYLHPEIWAYKADEDIYVCLRDKHAWVSGIAVEQCRKHFLIKAMASKPRNRQQEMEDKLRRRGEV